MIEQKSEQEQLFMITFSTTIFGNPAKVTKGEGEMKLRVNEIFGPTIQGEGKSAGREVKFLRLSGCNLACTWCDTISAGGRPVYPGIPVLGSCRTSSDSLSVER